MIKIAIVEDEMHYIEQLKGYLNRYQIDENELIKLDIFRDGEDIVEGYHGDYDIILMDIQMQFMNGMITAEKIREMDQEVIIIFITNMTQYALRGYAVEALDYVLKPVTYYSLRQKLNRAINKLKKKHNHYIYISLSDGVQRIDVSRILYIECEGHYLNYYSREQAYSSRGTIREVEEMLTQYGFVRINKGILVNMLHVSAMKNGCCLIGNQQLIVSRQRKKHFMEMLTNHISERVG